MAQAGSNKLVVYIYPELITAGLEWDTAGSKSEQMSRGFPAAKLLCTDTPYSGVQV